MNSASKNLEATIDIYKCSISKHDWILFKTVKEMSRFTAKRVTNSKGTFDRLTGNRIGRSNPGSFYRAALRLELANA